MPLKDDGSINEKTNELATLIPQCMLDGEGELFFFFFCGRWLVRLFPFVLWVFTMGLEVSLPFLFPCVGSPSIPNSLN